MSVNLASHAVPDALVDLSLVDAKQIAAAACISLTTWHELVRTGEAPAPAIRAQRFTRWRLVDVKPWMEKYIKQRMRDTEGVDGALHPVVEKARKARAAGLAKQKEARELRAELDAHKTEIDRLLTEQRAFVERIRELEAQLASKD